MVNAHQAPITPVEAQVLVQVLNRTWVPTVDYEEFQSGLRKLIIIANEDIERKLREACTK